MDMLLRLVRVVPAHLLFEAPSFVVVLNAPYIGANDAFQGMEHRPGAKLQFYLSFLQAKEQGLFALKPGDAELHACDKCGQPTTAPGECSFCRLWDKVRAVKGARLPASAAITDPVEA